MKWPAVIESYNPETRLYRISIPGRTDGAEVFPEAEALYPIGDDSRETEALIKNGAEVWVEFIGGDARHGLILGYRQRRVGNMVDLRYWKQANIELEAASDFYAHAGESVRINGGQTVDIEAGDTMTLKVGGSTIVITGDGIAVTTPQTSFTTDLATFSALVQVAGLLSANGGLAAVPGGGGGSAVAITGNVAITGSTTQTGSITVTGGDVKADGVGLKSHTHTDPQGGTVGTATG